MRALVIACWFTSACYSPHLDADPFACTLGSCPSGYRCVDQICVSDNAPAPPPLIAQVGAANVPAAPMWANNQFAVAWQDATGQLTGLRLTPYVDGAPDFDDAEALTADSGIVGAAALYDAHYVLAYTTSGALKLRTYDNAALNPTTLYENDEAAAAVGFSAPSLVQAAGDLVVGYTFNDQVSCERVHTDGTTASCQPTATLANGQADEAIVTALASTLYFYYHDYSDKLLYEFGASETQLPTFSHALGAVTLGNNVALLATDAQSQTHLTLRPSGTPDMTLAGAAAIASDGTKLYACVGGTAGPTIYAYDQTLTAIGAPITLARLSTAPVLSCRIALSPTQLFVVWYEGATNYFSLYGSVLNR